MRAYVGGGGSLYHFYVFDMTRPGREPATYRMGGGDANH